MYLHHQAVTVACSKSIKMCLHSVLVAIEMFWPSPLFSRSFEPADKRFHHEPN